jgi:hypothetical protein
VGRSESNVVVDAAEIRRLVDAYAVSMDTGDLELLAELFVPEGSLVVCTLGRAQPIATFVGTGADGIGVIPLAMAEVYESTMHQITTHFSRPDGARATGTTYCVADHVLKDSSTPVLESLGVRYREEWVRTDAGWRFARREVTRLWSSVGPTTSAPLGVDRAVAARLRG